MSWTADVKPGQVLKITKMVDDRGAELDLGEDHTVWGIVLDDESMMVFSKVNQRGYPGAYQAGAKWVSRVYPTDWADENSVWADADEVPDDVPTEFWPIAARAALNEGV